MSDQQQANKPALSLEEELDVLEAVYRIGQKKGLDLLRPEQVKKLRDAGRMEIQQINERPILHDERDNYVVLKELMTGLMGGLKDDYGEEFKLLDWDNASSEDKLEIQEALFKRKYGVFPDFFIQQIAR